MGKIEKQPSSCDEIWTFTSLDELRNTPGSKQELTTLISSPPGADPAEDQVHHNRQQTNCPNLYPA